MDETLCDNLITPYMPDGCGDSAWFCFVHPIAAAIARLCLVWVINTATAWVRLICPMAAVTSWFCLAVRTAAVTVKWRPAREICHAQPNITAREVKTIQTASLPESFLIPAIRSSDFHGFGQIRTDGNFYHRRQNRWIKCNVISSVACRLLYANYPNVGSVLEKKRSEGKCGKEAMVAGMNKFLSIYYGKVTELYRNLEL